MAAKHSASTYVALLRGINVVGKNMLAMKELAVLFSGADCVDVRTYIQSGNVIFGAPPAVAKGLAARLQSGIEERFGLRVPVLLRSVEQMGAVLRENPFLKAGAEAKTLHVFFLADAPDSASLANLDPDRSPPDKYAVIGREIYAQLPNGTARSKLTNAYFDSKLKTVSTVRNWNTVVKLFEMMQA